MRIEILNWAKYNPRTDVKANRSWLRFQSDFFEDPEFFDLSGTDLLIWIALCCARSKSRDPDGCLINVRQIAQYARTDEKTVHRGLQTFESLKKLMILDSARIRATQRPSPCSTDGTERYERDVTNETKRNETVSSPPSLPDPVTHPPALLATATEWLAYAAAEMPWLSKKWTVAEFADSLAKVQRATNVNDEGLVAVLQFVRTDEFWRDKACSPSGLLRKSGRNGLRKIDNILMGLKAATKPTKTEAMLAGLKEWAES